MQFLPVSDPRSFSLPIITASIIVVLILVLMSTNWIQSEVSIVKVPKHISAKIVHIDKPKPKTVKKKVKKKKPKPVVKAKKPKPKVVDKPKKEAKSKVKENPKPVKKAPLPLPGADLSQALQEEEALMDLNELLNEEVRAKQAEKDQKAITDIQSQIQALFRNVWSWPPSAKYTDEVLVRISLVPTGEVTDVIVIKSSGNEALDRSVELAVWKVAKLPVPKDAALFEREFRQFNFLFRPEEARL